MSHQGYLRNLKRATQFLTRRRTRRGAREMRRTTISFPFVSRRRRQRPNALSHLVSLAAPGLLLSLLGLTWLLASDPYRPPHTIASLWSAFFCIVSIVLAIRAATATAPTWMKRFAFAASLLYPVLLLLAWNGLLM